MLLCLRATELRHLWHAHYLDACNAYCRRHSLVSDCSSYNILPFFVTVISEANIVSGGIFVIDRKPPDGG